jgi:hypothetical protein
MPWERMAVRRSQPIRLQTGHPFDPLSGGFFFRPLGAKKPKPQDPFIARLARKPARQQMKVKL